MTLDIVFRYRDQGLREKFRESIWANDCGDRIDARLLGCLKEYTGANLIRNEVRAYKTFTESGAGFISGLMASRRDHSDSPPLFEIYTVMGSARTKLPDRIAYFVENNILRPGEKEDVMDLGNEQKQAILKRATNFFAAVLDAELPSFEQLQREEERRLAKAK